jgi:hypothetical protein
MKSLECTALLCASPSRNDVDCWDGRIEGVAGGDWTATAGAERRATTTRDPVVLEKLKITLKKKKKKKKKKKPPLPSTCEICLGVWLPLLEVWVVAG